MALDPISAVSQAFNNAISLVKKLVPDKDKQNEIIGALEAGKMEAYVAELQTYTIPWVDALHKMGRLLTNWALVGIIILFQMKGWEIDQNVVFLLGGGNIVYQLIKGKGK